jgi:hypothetical protein
MAGMGKRVDQVFGWLLVLGAAGHTLGTILSLSVKSDAFIWSLGSSLAAALLGTLNIIRAGRPQDKPLAVITAVGTACWALVAVGFGLSIGNVLDPRPASHAIISIVLVIFSIQTLRERAT